MRISTRQAVLGALAALAAWCTMGGLAGASFPNFSDCPTGLPVESVCIDVQSQSGELVIKGFHVPLDHSLEIRGGGTPENVFVPPTGTTGFFAQPVNVPGGLLGIELPLGFTMVTATAQLAGPPSSIHFEGLDISLPLKLHLTNPLMGSNCYIGSNSNPVRVHLITGTTSPPPPNMPISGHQGTVTVYPDHVEITGNLDVDNSFAIPGASGCALGLGLVDLLVDAKLGLPSSAGNNTLTLTSDIAIRNAP